MRSSQATQMSKAHWCLPTAFQAHNSGLTHWGVHSWVPDCFLSLVLTASHYPALALHTAELGNFPTSSCASRPSSPCFQTVQFSYLLWMSLLSAHAGKGSLLDPTAFSSSSQTTQLLISYFNCLFCSLSLL